MPGVIHLSGQNMYPDAGMKQKLINAAREAGLEYAYIVNNEGFTKIYVSDGKEELVRGVSLSRFDYKLFRKILGVSDKEFIHVHGLLGSSNIVTTSGPVSTYILPQSIIFEELEISKGNRSNLSTPYVIPKPIE